MNMFIFINYRFATLLPQNAFFYEIFLDFYYQSIIFV